MPAEALNIPCIDLSHPDPMATAAKIREACINSGFFYLVNHGIQEDDMKKVFDQARKFFALPEKEKLRLFRNKFMRGYTPFRDEILDASTQPQGDWKESYYIGPGCENLRKSAFHGPNQWPSEELLPMWRETMEDYYQKLINIGKKLIPLIALSLWLDPNFFNQQGMMDDPLAFLRILHYPGKSCKLQRGTLGAAAHTDYGMLTFLATDGVPGLQICRDKDAQPQIWEDVVPVKGAFIINIGDMLERWSNSLFRSTLHRVVTTGQERYSAAFFLDPNIDCLVECLPSCCSETNPPRFPAIRSGVYLEEKIKSAYASTH